MYELKGYIYNEKHESCPILEGIQVSGWEEAHELCKDLGIKYYLITLIKIKGDK